MLKKITVNKIMSWGPCYDKEYIQDIFKKHGKKFYTPLEIAKSGEKIDDILWILLRPEIISEMDLHELACKFAERALKRERKKGREPHIDSWNAIKVKRKWLKGKATDEELSAAESAAWYAAESAARSAAWSAARSAAWYAARSAESERKYQLKKVIKVLEKLEVNNES